MFLLGKSKTLSIFTALFLPLGNLNIFLKFMMAKKVKLDCDYYVLSYNLDKAKKTIYAGKTNASSF